MKTISLKKSFVLAVALCSSITFAKGQVEMSAGADLVSSYVWRGSYCGGVSIQPSLGLSAGGFSLSAWGSVGFTSPLYTDEFDFTAGYSVGGLSIAITDYWFSYGGGTDDWFNFKEEETAHMFEASLGYDFGPLALSWNTFFGGADFNSEGDRAYSTYISAVAPFSLGGLDMSVELGVTPWESIYADKFNLVNINITGSKEIKVTDSFSIPAFSSVIFNPAGKQTYFVFGLSF
ncbi:MAG: hypothetical protein LBR84_00215 [Tannerella sp.]|jgi:hypothetical protein|nr:hypothetical protein [Tannerella sp.]